MKELSRLGLILLSGAAVGTVAEYSQSMLADASAFGIEHDPSIQNSLIDVAQFSGNALGNMYVYGAALTLFPLLLGEDRYERFMGSTNTLITSTLTYAAVGELLHSQVFPNEGYYDWGDVAENASSLFLAYGLTDILSKRFLNESFVTN